MSDRPETVFEPEWAPGVTHPFNPFGAGRVLEAGEVTRVD